MNHLPGAALVLVLSAYFLACPGELRAADRPPLAPARGITEPLLDVLLSAAVPGIVHAQKFKEGDVVKEGDVICELDQRLEELEKARRQLVVDLRKADLDGTRVLFSKTTAVAKEELDKKEVDYKVALVEHDMAVEQLRRRQVTAPFSGVITELYVDVGEAVQPYQPIVRLVETRRCHFVSNVEGRAAAQLSLNQAVIIEVDTGSGIAQLPGKIIFLSPVTDPASGLLKIKALFDNSEGKIRPGLAGRIAFK